MIKKFSNPKSIYIFLSAILILVFIVSAILSPILITNEQTNWNTILTDKIEATQTSISNALDKKIELLTRSAGVIKPELRNGLFNLKSDYKNIFNLLSKHNDDEILIQLYDSSFSLIGWNAPTVIEDESVLSIKNYYSQTFFTDQKLITYLSFCDSIHVNNQNFLLLVSTPIEKHYSLSNEKSIINNFSDSLSTELSVRINIDYSPIAKFSKDGRKYSFPLLNNFQNKIGVATFDKPAFETAVNSIKNSIWLIQSIVLVLIIFLIGFLGYNYFKNLKRKILKIILLTFYLSVLRAALFYFEIPSSFVHNSLSDSSNFSSVFGYGIVRSPLEFTITVFFLLVVVMKGYKYFLNYLDEYKNENYNWKNIGITVISLFLLLLVYRGLAASIRSVIFDSNIRYFKYFSLLPEPSVLLMCLNILILAFCTIIFSIILFLWVFSCSQKLIKRNKKYLYLFLFLFIQVAGLLFDLIQNEPQGTPLIRVIYLSITFALPLIISSKNKKSILAYFYYSFAASVISVSLLTFYNSEIERESLKTTAHEITRTDENVVEFMVYQTLIQIQQNENIVNSFFNKNDLSPDAFIAWTNSMLYKEGLRSAVYFYDGQKNYIGGFSSSNSLFANRFSQLPDQSLDSLKITRKSNLFEDRITFVGSAPISSEDHLIGYAVVSTIYDEDYFNYADLPDFLIPQRAGISSAINYDKLKIFDFQNGELVRSYGNIALTNTTENIFLNASFTSYNEAWTNIELNNERYLFYLYRTNSPSTHKILAVGVEEKNFTWNLTDFFKIFFIHTLIILLSLFILALTKYKHTLMVLSSYRTRLIGAFMVVSLVPLFLIAIYFRNLTEEKNSNLITKRLTELAQQVESYLVLYSTESNVNSELIYEKAAVDLNIAFSLFKDVKMVYSTDNIYNEVGLLPQTIPANVYRETILGTNQNYFEKERFENQTINSIYHYSLIDGDEFVIQVSDLFNKVDLPLSDIELDIFLFGIFSLTVILLFIFSTLLAEQISAPIRKLTNGTKSVGEGDLDVEIGYQPRGEIKNLIDGFNSMVKRLRYSQIELAKLERESAWKEMAKQVAHEIKNPLTPMRLNVQQLITAHKDNSPKFNSIFEKVTSSLISQMEILKNIASEFSNFAQMPKLSISKLNAVPVIKDSLNLFNEEKRTITFESDSSEIYINADQDHLKRSIVNLIRNSIQAGANYIRVVLKFEKENCLLRVIDNGKGISSENIENIFEENFTTKTSGMGIGLSIAKRFIVNIGGSIIVESTSDEGTTFLITIPLAE